MSPPEARTRGWGRPCHRAGLPGRVRSALGPEELGGPEDCAEGSGQVWRWSPLTGKAI